MYSSQMNLIAELISQSHVVLGSHAVRSDGEFMRTYMDKHTGVSRVSSLNDYGCAAQQDMESMFPLTIGLWNRGWIYFNFARTFFHKFATAMACHYEKQELENYIYNGMQIQHLFVVQLE